MLIPLLLRCAALTTCAMPALTLHDGYHAPGPNSTVIVTAASKAAALDFFSSRVQANPADTIALSRLAVRQLDFAKQNGAHEDYAAAEASFRSWLGLDESSDGASIGLAYSLLGQHRFDEALGHARLAALRLPDEPQVWALIGDLHFALGNYLEADLAYRRLELRSLDMFSLSRRASIEKQRGEFEAARALYADALKAGELLEASPSGLAWCHTMLGDLDLEAGQIVQAEQHFLAATQLDPSSHASLYRQAQVEVAEGNASAALPMLRGLVEKFPRPRYWIALGDVLHGLGQDDEARALYDMAEVNMLANLAKGDIGHVRELSEFYVKVERKLEEALRLALLDRDEVRHDSATYETIAWALRSLGRFEEALAAVKLALRSGPSSVRLLCRAAVLCSETQRADEARWLLAVACERDQLLRAELGPPADVKLASALHAPRFAWVLKHVD